jgi:integrase
MLHGKDTWLGIGSYPDVSLAEARELAASRRKQIRAGIDPLAEKQAATIISKADRAKSVTFDWCSKQYIAAHAIAWRNEKHAAQWTNTLAKYASPVIGDLDVRKIETAHIMQIIEPFWHVVPETAARVRGRIETVLDWATVHKYRTGDNPSRWRGHIEMLLPKRDKAASVEHHPALPFAKIHSFMTALRNQEGLAARGVEFAILTAARSGEIRGATWVEIDLDAGLWTIPAARMKGKREHRVALSVEAKTVIERMKEIKSSDLVFPGIKEGKALSDMSLTAVLRRMDAEKLSAGDKGWRDENGDRITVHGFRSTFRDWAAEVTDYPNEMGEMAIAHAVSNAVEAAYRRGDMLEKRRAMMQDWSNYCSRNVKSIAVIKVVS